MLDVRMTAGENEWRVVKRTRKRDVNRQSFRDIFWETPCQGRAADTWPDNTATRDWTWLLTSDELFISDDGDDETDNTEAEVYDEVDENFQKLESDQLWDMTGPMKHDGFALF